MGAILVQFQSCSVCGCLEPRPGFVTAKAALNSDRMKVSCSMVSPCYIIIMFKTFFFTLQALPLPNKGIQWRNMQDKSFWRNIFPHPVLEHRKWKDLFGLKLTTRNHGKDYHLSYVLPVYTMRPKGKNLQKIWSVWPLLMFIKSIMVQDGQKSTRLPRILVLQSNIPKFKPRHPNIPGKQDTYV